MMKGGARRAPIYTHGQASPDTLWRAQGLKILSLCLPKVQSASMSLVQWEHTVPSKLPISGNQAPLSAQCADTEDNVRQSAVSV